MFELGTVVRRDHSYYLLRTTQCREQVSTMWVYARSAHERPNISETYTARTTEQSKTSSSRSALLAPQITYSKTGSLIQETREPKDNRGYESTKSHRHRSRIPILAFHPGTGLQQERELPLPLHHRNQKPNHFVGIVPMWLHVSLSAAEFTHTPLTGGLSKN